MQAELTRKRLERAGKLTSGLASEGVRWGSAAEALAAQAVQLVSV
jgi:dynein heavy chain